LNHGVALTPDGEGVVFNHYDEARTKDKINVETTSGGKGKMKESIDV